MRLTRVHVDAVLVPGQRARLEGSAANHVTRVLRARVGDELTLFDGRGSEYGARIEEFRKEAVVVAVGEERAVDRESPLPLTLAQGVSRGERMDWVVQKATELGVSRIVPVMTERTVVRLDEQQAQKRTQHWRAIAVAACEQSGRNRVPEITAPLGFHEVMRADTGTRAPTRLLLSPTGQLRLDDLEKPTGGVVVLIGPEGGLTDSEQEQALGAGFLPLRLGPRILRTETAAIAALTIIQREFGDL